MSPAPANAPDSRGDVVADAGSRRWRRWLLLSVAAAVLAGTGWAGWRFWTSWESRDWRSAQDALRRHDLPEAAACLDRHLSRRPDDADAWFLAARTARRLERSADAERYLERCQQLAGVNDATRLEWDLLRVQQGDLRDIHFRLRATIGPDHPDALLVLEALARGYLKCERLMDARQACELWIERQPDHPWPWLWRGSIFERIGQTDEAKDDYARAVANAPDDRDARLALANVLFRQRQPGAAVEHFERILERSADDEAALLGLASCRIDQGQPDQALQLLERVASSSPTHLFLRGKADWQRGEYESAERWLRQAVQAAPDDANPLYLLVQCLVARHQEAEADQLHARLEKLRIDLHRLHELTRSVALQPDDARPRHEAGVIALRIGRTAEGLRWLNSALRVNGDHRPVHAALADHHELNGDRAAAAHHRRLAESP